MWKERPERTNSVVSVEGCLHAGRGDEVGEWSWMEELWVGRARLDDGLGWGLGFLLVEAVRALFEGMR